VTAIWAFVLLGRSADWQAWLRPTVLIAGVVAAIAVLATARVRFGALAAGVAVVAALAAPMVYSVQTAAAAHAGAIPTAGPMVIGGPGGFGGPGRFGGPGGVRPGDGEGGRVFAAPGGQLPAFGGGETAMPLPPAGLGGGGPRGMGGLLDAGTPSTELKSLLEDDAASYTWVAATVGANNAAGIQLGTGLPVMAIGGFNGSDPAPTLAQFQQYVASGRVHYVIGGGGFRANGGSQAAADIAAWVEENFTATTVGDTTVYDLTAMA
jgi:hypothetical protein